MAATRDTSSALGRLRALAADPPAAPGPPRPVALLALACLALAALSLLGPSTPTYDPWAWIIWGREVAAARPRHHRRAVVEAAADPVHRAVLARRRRRRRPSCGSWSRAPAGCWRSRWRSGSRARLAGPVGGRDRRRRARARGRVRAQLRARQLRGAARRASACWRSSATSTAAAATRSCSASLAGLLRPEVWPLWGSTACGSSPAPGAAGRRGGRSRSWAAPALVTLLVWFVPEYLGSGSLLRAAERARQPNPDSAAFAGVARSWRCSAARPRSCPCRSTRAP